MIQYTIIGLMSGTSMDGLDVACVRFVKNDRGNWSHEVIAVDTFSYDSEYINELKGAHKLAVPQLLRLDKRTGKIYAEFVSFFLKKHQIKKETVDCIASHGQTIFHQPDKGFTLQIGCGTTLAFLTGIKVVNDFRTKDIVAGGQGAPLVPVGDFKLYEDRAKAFLNIGGIANISFKRNENIIAYDICPGNLPLNKLAESKGLAYDKDGELAAKGEINFFLLDLLNELEYYHLESPKSLGTEWLESNFYPLVKFDKDIENNLRTVIEHEAIQITNVLEKEQIPSVMISGGGAKNTFLIERIRHYYKGEVILPEPELIDFKEAVIFAFLAALYFENEPNALSSVTGASADVSGGILHKP